jgi:hypothetical protein
MKVGKTLPWKTVRDSINAALQARFLEVAEASQAWPCDLPSAQFAKFKVASGADRVETGWRGVADVAPGMILVAAVELQPAQVQDLGDIVPKLLEVRARGVCRFGSTCGLRLVTDRRFRPRISSGKSTHCCSASTRTSPCGSDAEEEQGIAVELTPADARGRQRRRRRRPCWEARQR